MASGQSPNPQTKTGAGASIGLDVLYLFAGFLLIPFFIYRRLIKRKRSAPWSAKLGYITPRPQGTPRVWIHAVSVGEATAAEPLVKALKRRYPKMDVVISTTTVTGHEVAIQRYGAENVIYYPTDLSCAVCRTLDRLQPDIILLMELEVWPNLTAEAAARHIPILVVNGRITARSAKRYKKFWCLAGPGFLRITEWLVQSAEYADRLTSLGVLKSKIQISGNIKYDAVDTILPTPEERDTLRTEFGLVSNLGTPVTVLMGGSTHPTEEAALLRVYAALKKNSFPNLRLVVVPRHPERIGSVLAEIAAAGFKSVRRSEMQHIGRHHTYIESPLHIGGHHTYIKAQRAFDISMVSPDMSPDMPVIVVDTIGELKSLYKVADVVFVGGSLIPHGGQNVMEPCGLGVPVVYGPHMHNFNEARELLRECHGAIEVSHENFLFAVQHLFENPDDAKAMATRARAAFLSAQGATTLCVDRVDALLKGKFNC